MNTHTPGPWRRGSHLLTSNGDTIVARLEGIREHDACLIEAAPDLLAALKLALSMLELYTADEPRGILAKVICAAIAKAEGTS